MTNRSTVVELAEPADAAALSVLAAATFPLACPPHATAADIAAFIADVLSKERFVDYLADANRTVLKAVIDGDIVGYALLVATRPTDPDVLAAIADGPVVELSKLYVAEDHHGNGIADDLMNAAVAVARDRGAPALWLGVNNENARAQRFYGKQGFVRVGTKTFTVGAQLHHDFVLQREL
ncbi:GNAT family N-acetyltransferase [Nocardia camponoti]|uniref:N-acetyltransferase n=1 Tax=Nocardia camponoti TaxID=1616106 RepID=A0A917QB71_9NOCA|nr:GNAT family N-acetyltransferase [Nocardia camponoti]GGK40808.1 N-acetyltransferase [Nocardia camponoti]